MAGWGVANLVKGSYAEASWLVCTIAWVLEMVGRMCGCG